MKRKRVRRGNRNTIIFMGRRSPSDSLVLDNYARFLDVLAGTKERALRPQERLAYMLSVPQSLQLDALTNGYKARLHRPECVVLLHDVAFRHRLSKIAEGAGVELTALDAILVRCREYFLSREAREEADMGARWLETDRELAKQALLEINRIRGHRASRAAANAHDASGRPGNEDYELSTSAKDTETQKRIEPEPRSVAVDDQPPTEDESLPEDAGTGSGVWDDHDDGGQPLRGWADICKRLGRANNKNTREQLKRLNATTGGPIVWVANKPEVNAGKLSGWIADVEGRARRAAELRESRAGAIRELEERGGIRQQDQAFHEEKRPNARGKARPAPDTNA